LIILKEKIQIFKNMTIKRDILKLFPTKERLVTFVRAYYSLFSRRLNVTAENFDTDDIDIHRGPYWKFWLNTAKFVGLQDHNYEAFFFLMNCISENIILLDQKQLTVENIVVPTYKEYSADLRVDEDSHEYGEYVIEYEGYITKTQLENYDNYEELIPDWSNPYEYDPDYRDSEVDNSDVEMRDLNLENEEDLYE